MHCMSYVAKLSVGEHELELPVIVGTEDEQGIDISKLRGLTDTSRSTKAL